MANSNALPQHAEESSSQIYDANTLTDSSSPNAFVSDVTELAFLQKLISSPGPSEEEGDISALLKQLEAADGVAKGVESKLDRLLEDLEGMLKGLEGSCEIQPEDGTHQSTTEPRQT